MFAVPGMRQVPVAVTAPNTREWVAYRSPANTGLPGFRIAAWFAGSGRAAQPGVDAGLRNDAGDLSKGLLKSARRRKLTQNKKVGSIDIVVSWQQKFKQRAGQQLLNRSRAYLFRIKGSLVDVGCVGRLSLCELAIALAADRGVMGTDCCIRPTIRCGGDAEKKGVTDAWLARISHQVSSRGARSR